VHAHGQALLCQNAKGKSRDKPIAKIVGSDEVGHVSCGFNSHSLSRAPAMLTGLKSADIHSMPTKVVRFAADCVRNDLPAEGPKRKAVGIAHG
jgi:hypothetical protein